MYNGEQRTANSEQRTANSEQRTANSEHAELGFSNDPLAARQYELLNVLRQVAPELLRDNQLDIDGLKALLGNDWIAPPDHYELSWAGKNLARREIQKTTSHTLLPSPENPVEAQHMLIEGENLEVLRVLQKSYYGKVKMIYIDPPYNTGSDSFVYPDDYSETLAEYQKRTGEKDAAGFLNKQSLWKANSKESGQYHSAWLSMMYPRLFLARNLLREDGVIVIQIDDNEFSNLKILCDEIFGEDNLVSTVAVKMSHLSGMKMSHVSRKIPKIKEFLLVYAKFKSEVSLNKVSIPCDWEDTFDRYTRIVDNIDSPISQWTYSTLRSALLEVSEGDVVQWRLNNAHRIFRTAVNDSIEKMKDDTFRPLITKTGLEKISLNGEEVLFASRNLVVVDGVPTPVLGIGDIWTDIGINNLHNEGGVDFSNGKKPLKLLDRVVRLTESPGKDDIILDFFAGSGTTAHAVMELNAEDGGMRQSISVQYPEPVDEKSEAYKAGYRTIADITRARIQKVIEKLQTEHPENAKDLACAHFTLAPSNFKIWQTELDDGHALRSQLEAFQDGPLDSETSQDAQRAKLSELFLKLGLGALGVHAVNKPKTLPCGITIHRVMPDSDRRIFFCFEPYQDALKDEVIAGRATQLVLLNACFQGAKADEQLSNLKLELAGLDIDLVVI